MARPDDSEEDDPVAEPHAPLPNWLLASRPEKARFFSVPIPGVPRAVRRRILQRTKQRRRRQQQQQQHQQQRAPPSRVENLLTDIERLSEDAKIQSQTRVERAREALRAAEAERDQRLVELRKQLEAQVKEDVEKFAEAKRKELEDLDALRETFLKERTKLFEERYKIEQEQREKEMLARIDEEMKSYEPELNLQTAENDDQEEKKGGKVEENSGKEPAPPSGGAADAKPSTPAAPLTNSHSMNIDNDDDDDDEEEGEIEDDEAVKAAAALKKKNESAAAPAHYDKESDRQQAEIDTLQKELDGLAETKHELVWLMKRAITAEAKRKAMTEAMAKKKKAATLPASLPGPPDASGKSHNSKSQRKRNG